VDSKEACGINRTSLKGAKSTLVCDKLAFDRVQTYNHMCKEIMTVLMTGL